MSIIGITSTSGAIRSATPTPSDIAATRTASPDAAQTDQAEETPKPVHFPWLSRLSAGLEAASNKRAPFSTQIMGDNLDKQA